MSHTIQMKQKHLLLRAAFQETIERPPVWVMRQAGRYLPEYRAIRSQAKSFLNLCYTPELAAEVSCQPWELIGVDAIIMFSDILTPLVGLGLDLSFDAGPVFLNPIRTLSDVQALSHFDPEKHTDFVGKTLDLIQKRVQQAVPILGFAGAPFTLACYAISGKKITSFAQIKRLLHEDKPMMQALMEKLTDLTIRYLNYQIACQVDMIQLFDTWAGVLSPEDYKEFVFPYVEKIFASLDKKGEVPYAYYIRGGEHLRDYMATSGANIIALDWMSDLTENIKQYGDKVAIQGNFDPDLLFCEPHTIQKLVEQKLTSLPKKTGFIFNLGHGIDKEVPPEHLRSLVNTIKAFRF